MLGNWFAQRRYNEEIENLEKELKTKTVEKQESCNCCSFCCWIKPCNLDKDDIQIMSKHFKITPQYLFKKYLVVDDAGAKYGYFTLTPIREEWEIYTGKYLPSNATFDIKTPCLFLEQSNKKCTLHNIAKPIGGRQSECWNVEKKQEIPCFTKQELKDIVGWDGDTKSEDDE